MLRCRVFTRHTFYDEFQANCLLLFVIVSQLVKPSHFISMLSGGSVSVDSDFCWDRRKITLILKFTIQYKHKMIWTGQNTADFILNMSGAFFDQIVWRISPHTGTGFPVFLAP